MKTLKLLPAAVILGLSGLAQAGYVELGAEYEDFNSSHNHNDFVMPYLATGFTPVADLPLHFAFKFSDKQATRTSTDATSGREFSNDRSRQEYIVWYDYDVTDKFTFSPRLNIRHNEYSQTNTHDTEWRIHPNMTYAYSDMVTLALDGFVAPVTAKSVSRGNDTGNLNNYTDYLHELDFQVRTQLNESQAFRASIYSEYKKTSNTTLASEADTMEEWQLRLIYSHQFDRFSISPFARLNLKRDFKNAVGEKKDQARNRYGVFGDYLLTSNMNVVYEAYYQSEEQKNYQNESLEIGDQDKMFYKLGLRYNF
ncbi:hypothetical protein BIZ37_01350 [Photobacterium sp. BZF1]|uniref:hypothetical protein n=1 Tax=Photobacterium sp. BZF1 TaxID=1904457 RepID=UPI001653666F|nr:hypothetical protein [Photobacterium sp. BZF1]MBC7001188.1 hypothetical protein [Photobacterium sp. BZF1]